jgi:hypothetical protein
MQERAKLYYKKRSEIDTNRWNDCVDNAPNGSFYAYSFYLDCMADNWDALVMGDYEAIMPLPWRKKFMIRYLYQPFLTPQLGLIANTISADLLKTFLSFISGKFSFLEISLNDCNVFDNVEFPLQKKVNYFLPLGRSYDKIAEGYNQNLKRNIKKALSGNCCYKENVALEEILIPAIKQFRQYADFSNKDVVKFKTLVGKLLLQKKAQCIGVYQNNILQAGCIFLLGPKTANYILATSTFNGKKNGASHYLLDQFIRRNAGKTINLDFAGSDVPSVAFFYKSFGAQVSFYSSLRINNLPPLIKWVKN